MKALDYLQKAYESRSLELMYLNLAPAFWFDCLREEPRFQDLLRRLE